MNKAILMGRLTRDAEIRTGNNGIVARFSIAVDRRFKRDGEPTADFFNCVAFGKQAEFVEKYLSKGIKIVLTGSIQNNNYTDSNGNKVYSTVIVCESIEFAESKNSSHDSGNDSAGMKTLSEFEGVNDEDLPFN